MCDGEERVGEEKEGGSEGGREACKEGYKEENVVVVNGMEERVIGRSEKSYDVEVEGSMRGGGGERQEERGGQREDSGQL